MAIVWPFERKKNSHDGIKPETNKAEVYHYVSKNDKNISVIEMKNFKNVMLDLKLDLKNTENTEKSGKKFCVALLVDVNDNFYVELLENTALDVTKLFSNNADGYWRSCYIFTHNDTTFPDGYELVFKNQLIKLLKNTGHNVLNHFEVVDGISAQTVKVSEISVFETFWKEILEILYSEEAKTVGWSLFFDKNKMMKERLFNNDFLDSSNNNDVVIDPDEISKLLKLGRKDSIVKYTLEDDLGNVISGTLVQGVLLFWLRELYKVDFYKRMLSRVAKHESQTHTPIKDRFFCYGYEKFSYNIGYEEDTDRYVLLNVAAKWESINRGTVNKYLTEDDMKRRLMLLSSMMGIQISLKEEIVSELPSYDEKFAEKISKDRKLREQKFSELKKALSDEEVKDKEFLNNLLNPVEDENNVVANHTSLRMIESSSRGNSKVSVEEFDSAVEELNNFSSKKVFKEVFSE